MQWTTYRRHAQAVLDHDPSRLWTASGLYLCLHAAGVLPPVYPDATLSVAAKLRLDLIDNNEIEIVSERTFRRRSFVDRDPIDPATLAIPGAVLFSQLDLAPIDWPDWMHDHPFGEPLMALEHEIQTVVPGLVGESTGILHAQLCAWAGTVRLMLDRAGNCAHPAKQPFRRMADQVMEQIIHARRRLGVTAWVESLRMDWDTCWESYVAWQQSVVRAEPAELADDDLRECARDTARALISNLREEGEQTRRVAHFHLRRLLAVLDANDPALAPAIEKWGVPVNRRGRTFTEETARRQERAASRKAVEAAAAARKRARIAKAQAEVETAALRRAEDARKRCERDTAATENTVVPVNVLAFTRGRRLFMIGGVDQFDLLQAPLQNKLELAALKWVAGTCSAPAEQFWNEATGVRQHDLVFVVVEQRRADVSALVRACAQTDTPLIYLFQGFSLRLICKSIETHLRLAHSSG